jgi:hypothetical protein
LQQRQHHHHHALLPKTKTFKGKRVTATTTPLVEDVDCIFLFFFCFFLISLGAREKKKDDRAPVSGGYQKWGSLVIGGSLNNDRDSPKKKRNKPDLDI